MILIKRINRYAVNRAVMLWLMLKRHWVVWTNVNVHIGPNVTIFPGVRFQVTDGGRLIIHSGSSIGAGTIITAYEGLVEIGANTHIGPWSVICAREAITIGRDVLIAERVTIRDQFHAMSLPGPMRLNGMDSSPIEIQSDVWIGANAVILKGLTIATGSVVGASSVVNRSVMPNQIVAGVPAKQIGMRSHD